MLATVATLAVLAVRVFAWNEYDFGVPNGNSIDGLEYRELSRDWQAVPAHLGGFDVVGGSTSPFQVGWRLASEGDSSAIVYKYNSSVVPLLSKFTEGGHEIDVFWIHTINQDYPTDEAKSAVAKRDIWDNGSFTPLPFQSRVLSIINSACDDGMALTLETWDANGVYQILNGTDRISYTLPDAFPFNVTAAATEYATYAELYITGDEQILYALGEGTVPTVTTGYNLQVQVCPD